jgi:hypothetical protein
MEATMNGTAIAFESVIEDGVIRLPDEYRARFTAFTAPALVIVKERAAQGWWQETRALLEQAHGNSHGQKWTREDLHRG